MEPDRNLAQAGLIREGASAHCSRTMMLDELAALLDAETDDLAGHGAYRSRVEQDNCLAKRTASTRKITFAHLSRLYGLNPDIPVFRALRHLWRKDPLSLPLLAILCAYGRDPLLHYVAPFILKRKPGDEISNQAIAAFLEKKHGARFSQATINSASRNIRSSFTQSGHLQGHSRKIRSRVNATPASVTYALYLGHLEGLCGKPLFQTGYMAFLDCNLEKAFAMAQTAAQKGWLVVKRIDDIIEITFPEWR
ncbi:MAG: hypothetical protein HDQ91_06835 [Desulfovibrio sp.]|nr:hypothetical protein [Desulfovibrio sp.]